MFLQVLISMALAAPGGWLVKAPQANPHEFFVFAQNSPEGKVSQAFTACEKTDGVDRLLKQAQFNFLNGSLDESRKQFSRLTEMKWSCDWKEDERKIITFAFFRLAQLSAVPAEQLGFLTDAIGFDDDITPDAGVFPPPLVEMYRDTKTQMLKQQLLLPDFTKKYSGLLRNGKPVSLTSLAFSTYPLRARYTLTSDTYRTETLVTTAEEFRNYELEPRALIDGTCEKFSAAEDLQQLGNYKVFFSPDCIKEGVVSAPAVANVTPNLANTVAANGGAGPRHKTWLERNLLWVGVAVVSSVAIAQVMKNGESHETVTRPTNTLTDH